MKKVNLIVEHYGRFNESYKVGNGSGSRLVAKEPSCSDVLQRLGYVVTKKGRFYDYLKPPKLVDKRERLTVVVDILEKEEIFDFANKLYLNGKSEAGEFLCWPYYFRPSRNSISSAIVFNFGGGRAPEVKTETIDVNHDAYFKIGVSHLWEASIKWKNKDIVFHESIKTI